MGALPCEISSHHVSEVAVGGCLFIDGQAQIQSLNDSQRGQFKAAIYSALQSFSSSTLAPNVSMRRDTGSAMPIA